jgi:hypothetical protein
MTTVIGEVTPYALAIALSPLGVIVAILLLFTPRPRPAAGAFLIGWAVGSPSRPGRRRARVGHRTQGQARPRSPAAAVASPYRHLVGTTSATALGRRQPVRRSARAAGSMATSTADDVVAVTTGFLSRRAARGRRRWNCGCSIRFDSGCAVCPGGDSVLCGSTDSHRLRGRGRLPPKVCTGEVLGPVAKQRRPSRREPGMHV